MGGGVFHRRQYLDYVEDVPDPTVLGVTVLGFTGKAFG